jgi:hypothetical protein
VKDYAGGKQDWIDAGLPIEHGDAAPKARPARSIGEVQENLQQAEGDEAASGVEEG